MARYLVTGGCGFIGGHLTRALVDAGHRVTVLDNLSSGFEGNLADEADLCVGCVTDSERVATLAARSDGILHLAAIASVEAAAADPRRAEAVNIGGTRNALAAAKSFRIPLVFASSAAVYGDAGAGPISEHEGCAPLSAYGRQKLQGERDIADLGPMATIVRPFNVYGPRQDPTSPYSGVIARFILATVAGETLTINGEGTQSRDFIFVGDIVRLFVAALTRETVAPLTVNGCTGTATSVHALAECVAAACNSRPRLRKGPARPGDIQHSLGDPAHAATELDFSAGTTLADGLKATVDWYLQQRPDGRPLIQ